MIKIFQATDKLYSTNGDLVLKPLKAQVHKEDNGDFYLDLETLLDEKEISVISQIGETITTSDFVTLTNVNNTLEKEIKKIEGNTTQSGTPTPDYPQPINVVSGRQEVVVASKNYFNPTKEWSNDGVDCTIDNQKITFNGTSTAGRTYETVNTPIPSGTYKISLEVLNETFTPQRIWFDFFKGNTKVAYPSITGTGSTNLSLPNGADTIKLGFDNNKTFDNYTFRVQIEAGNQATNWVAYEKTNTEINLGKNLVDFDNPSGVYNCTYDTTTKIYTTSALTGDFVGINIWTANTPLVIPTGTSTFYYSADIKLASGTYNDKINLFREGQAYTGLTKVQTNISNPIISNEYQRYIFKFDYTNTSGNFISSSNNFIQLTRGASNAVLEIKNVMISKSDTTYAPYKTPIELCKIGDYKDRIYKDNGTWYLHKEIGKVVLDGSEDWQREEYTTGNYRYRTQIISSIQQNTRNICYSNYFHFISSGHEVGGAFIFGGYFYAYPNANITTANDFKTWLSTHNTIVYYILATPTTTEITDTELISQLESLQLLNGLNNISITSGDLTGSYAIHYNYGNEIINNIKYIDYLVPNNIIVANTPQGDQAFRISNVEKTRTKIKIKANHVFYDSTNYLIEDSYVVDKNCNDALDHLNNATSDLSPYTTISNINTIASFRCVRKSLYEAIQVVLERWGGHLVRNNWTIGIYDTIGQDNGVTIRYAKNLKNITATYDWNEVVTKLLPVGKDGLLLNEIDPTASLYVEAATQYDIPYTKTISFDQSNIVEDDYKDEDGELDVDTYKQALVDDLYAQATEYITNNYLPKVNYNLSANVEKVSDIGDTIEVIDEKLGINIMTNIISYNYDCILEKYIQLEFGNFTPQLKDLMSTITETTEKIVDEQNSTLAITLEKELNEATEQIWNALGNSYVIYEGDKILIVDTLPKENATNVIMLNNGGIGFSNTGITGTFSSAWTIDNVLNMENINVINLTADLIKGGTLKLGSNLNQNGQIEVYDEANNLIAELNKNGLKMYGVDGSYVLMNNQVGFAGYDRNNNPIYWVSKDEFHMKKSVVEEEITLVNKMRIIPITIRNGNTIVNDGIGFINVPN